MRSEPEHPDSLQHCSRPASNHKTCRYEGTCHLKHCPNSLDYCRFIQCELCVHSSRFWSTLAKLSMQLVSKTTQNLYPINKSAGEAKYPSHPRWVRSPQLTVTVNNVFTAMIKLIYMSQEPYILVIQCVLMIPAQQNVKNTPLSKIYIKFDPKS